MQTAGWAFPAPQLPKGLSVGGGARSPASDEKTGAAPGDGSRLQHVVCGPCSPESPGPEVLRPDDTSLLMLARNWGEADIPDGLSPLSVGFCFIVALFQCLPVGTTVDSWKQQVRTALPGTGKFQHSLEVDGFLLKRESVETMAREDVRHPVQCYFLAEHGWCRLPTHLPLSRAPGYHACSAAPPVPP